MSGADVFIVGEDCLGWRIFPRLFHQVVVVDVSFLVITSTSSEKAKQGTLFGRRFNEKFGRQFRVGVSGNVVGRIHPRIDIVKSLRVDR